MTTITVGRRGQVTLPKYVRKILQIEEGDHIAFIQQGERIFIQPLTKTLLDMRGSVQVSEPQDFEEIRAQVIREQMANRNAG